MAITILCVFARFYAVDNHKKRQRITNLSICAVYTKNNTTNYVLLLTK